jgi:hypothetical protein
MNGYEAYLEKVIELREKEVGIYKDFIENQLGRRIQEAVETDKIWRNGVEEVDYKVITIPKSQYVVQLG